MALNDEVWSGLGGAVTGPVRLGVSPDLLGTRFSPVLKRFAAACPEVESSLRSGASADLTRDFAAGRLDLAVVEEPVGSTSGELLAVDRLVWVGARGGSAHRRTPLPVSTVADACVFKPAMVAALGSREGDWRAVSENGGLEATFATVRADLAVSAWLAATVPAGLDVLPPDAGMPELPLFAIALHGPGDPAASAAAELARQVRDGFGMSGSDP